MHIRGWSLFLIGFLFLPGLVLADSSTETKIIISPVRETSTSIVFEEEFVEIGVPLNLAQTGDQIPVALTLVYRNPLDKKQDLVENIPLPDGAELAQVLINGQEVSLLPEDQVKPFYPLRLTLLPHIRATVIIIFNMKAVVTANFQPVFQVGTAASDQLPIGKTHFIVHYPLDIQAGWISSSGTPFAFAGDDASTTARLTRPGESVFSLQILLPHDGERIMMAEKRLQDQPKTLDLVKELADVYRSLRQGNKQNRPLFAQQKYLELEHRYVLAKYGSLTQPKTLQEALELAGMYSNGWSAPCPVLDECLNDWEEDPYRQLMTYVDQQTWDMSAPVEKRALQEIKQHDAEWKQKRTGTPPSVIPAKTGIQHDDPLDPRVKPEDDSAVDWRWMVGGGVVLVLLLHFGLRKFAKKIK